MDEAHLNGLENRKGKLPVFSDDDNNALVSDSKDYDFDEMRKKGKFAVVIVTMKKKMVMDKEKGEV